MDRHWLMKSEPSSFSVNDLLRRPRRTEPWDGVRNYQARNLFSVRKANDREQTRLAPYLEV